MALVSLQNISSSFGLAPVLDSVSLNIEAGERAAVTGRNGEGKSTLLKIIAGSVAPDSGEIIVKPGTRIAYLPQDAEDGQRPMRTVSETVDRLPLTDKQIEPHLLARFLTQLGVPEGAPFEKLSGGQRRRVLLAERLAREPDLLLLDEPTNHLDMRTIEWLEDFLSRAPLTCLFVTHDRAFLRRTARRILDIDRGRLSGWDCDYATFLRRKAQILEDDAAVWERKGKLLAREEEWIRRGVRARRTRNEGRVEALRALRAEFAGRRAEIGSSRLAGGMGESSGQKVAEFKNVSFTYEAGASVPPDLFHTEARSNKPSRSSMNQASSSAPLSHSAPVCEPLIIKDFSATILRGEKIGIIGANGAGKTTLIKLITGELSPTSGEVRLGARVQIASVDQMREQLDLEKTVVENIAQEQEFVMVNGARRHIYGYLQDFLFTPERARTPVKALSGGERARVGIAKLFLNLGNLLILDEPTNDLDIETLELLEEQLLSYPGTLILVSHDREFMDNVVTSSFVLPGNGEVIFCPGGYSEWKKMSGERLNDERPRIKRDDSTLSVQHPPSSASSKRLGYMEKRELDSLPEKISALEKEITDLKALLSDGFVFSREPAKATESASRLQNCESELETLVERWMELESRA